MQSEVSAGAVIFRKENGTVKYLLLHYTSGHWDYVKGHIEAGEDELSTVKRECEEETGITDLIFTPGFRHEISYFFRKNSEIISKKVYFYLAETKTADVKLTEHTEFKWLPYEEAIKLVTFSNSRELLKKANKIVEKL